MRAEIVSARNKVVGRAKVETGYTHLVVDHIGDEAGVSWRIVTFFGRTIVQKAVNTIRGDSVVIDLRGLENIE